MLSNQSPAPTAPPSEPLQPTAPIQPPALTYQPVEPLQPAIQAPLQAPLQRSSGVWVAERAVMITYLVLSLVEALLITRVILKLLAANPEAGFVRVIYDRSALLRGALPGDLSDPRDAEQRVRTLLARRHRGLCVHCLGHRASHRHL